MPISKYFSGHGSEVMRNMKKQYGAKKGKQVFYATANKRDKGFYGHLAGNSVKAGRIRGTC